MAARLEYTAGVTLRLYDTATRDVRDFVPLEPGRAGIYVCGLDGAGGAARRARPLGGQLRRAAALAARHSGYEVTFVRNVTDIDDKILAKAAEQGRPWLGIAYADERELAKALRRDQRAAADLRAARDRARPEMLDLIAQLIARGHAYAAEDGSGDVYFDVRSWPAYGELTRQRIDDMEPAGDADPRGKRDPRDFALWKGCKKETSRRPRPGRRPWGPGRPGWHIECSAMAGKYLGPAFDIHGGGVDLRFPHHENEQAQSRAAGHPFASYWLHNAWITTAGEKMSKSLGNSLLVPEVLKRVRGIELRFYMVSAHYRSHVEFSFEALDEAAPGLPADRGLPRARGRHRPGRRRAARSGASSRPWTTTSARRPRSRSIHDAVREGNRLLADGDARAAPRGRGLGPRDARRPRPRPRRPRLGPGDRWRREAHRRRRRAGRGGLLDARAGGPGGQGLRARADAIRDRLTRTAGIEIEDTPRTARQLELETDGRQLAAQGRDPQDQQEADRRLRRAGPPRARGQGPDAQGEGPARTTRPTSRRRAPSASEAKKPRRRTTEVDATPSGWPDATPCSRCCAPGSRSTACTSPRAPSATAGSGTRSRSPPSPGISLLEVTRARAGPDDRRGRPPGPGRPDPGRTSTPTPTTCSASPSTSGSAAADRRPRLGDRPAQPRRGDPLGGRLRRARRADPRASGRGHDGVGLEDLGRRGGPDPGRADRQPGPPAQGLPGRGLHGGRPGLRRRREPARPRPRRRTARPRRRLARARACPAWSPRPATSSCRSRCPTRWSRSTPASRPPSRCTPFPGHAPDAWLPWRGVPPPPPADPAGRRPGAGVDGASGWS